MTKQYIADSNIDPDGYRGTWDQWAACVKDTNWYSEYVDMCRPLGLEPKTLEAWVEDTLNASLMEAGEDDMGLPELEY